jgi:GAF domain-containing protein
VILPLAHHNAIVALPVFAPAVVIVLVLVVHHLRERRHWDDEDETAPES